MVVPYVSDTIENSISYLNALSFPLLDATFGFLSLRTHPIITYSSIPCKEVTYFKLPIFYLNGYSYDLPPLFLQAKLRNATNSSYIS